ncbi:MAG: hypothetical protein HGA33_06640, partial [Candidatus Moranbacteria bacterium]|nr:hypothetical protein [Candidatus Moranbacteria bacterium]
EGENGDTRITDCDDTDWRNRVTKIKSQGGAGSTTRAVEVAVAQASSDFEKGMIVMWSGSIGDIPDGWALCDGDNGTPDLTDRFVVGAGGDFDSGATGGNRDTSLSISNMPSHQHYVANSSSATGGLNSTTTILANSDHGNGGSYYFAGRNLAANVGLSSSVGSGTSFTNMPPYLALAYIMKVD